MFVGENLEATEKYKEENLKRFVSISTTQRLTTIKVYFFLAFFFF